MQTAPSALGGDDRTHRSAVPAPHTYGGRMNQVMLDIVSGIGVPAASILVSTWVAVGLAWSERKSAADARVEERLDAAFVRTLTALAQLNTISPSAFNVSRAA